MEHSVREEKSNPHVIGVQHLITDRTVYERGQTVTFIAVLGADAYSDRCDSFFVTAAALSPSHQRAYKLILRPFAAPLAQRSVATFTHGEPGHVLEQGLVRRCLDFGRQKVGDAFHARRVIDGLSYDPLGASARFVADSAGSIVLALPAGGLEISLPTPATAVTLRLELPANESVTVRALSGDAEVDRDDRPASNDGGEATQQLRGTGITRVVVDGRRGLRLVQICLERGGRGCLYRGTLNLATDEETGSWSTYLFAQTRNDVALGIDPLVAAETIGGLPVTNNFFFAGDSDNITYGHACNIDIAADGAFEVVAADPAVIG